MSCDYFVFCATCQSRHDFADANHRADLMRQLIAHAAAIAGIAPVVEAAGELQLRTNYGAIDAAWFSVHHTHELRVIDEYGRFDAGCHHRVKCDHCHSEHWCTRQDGHDGLCSPYPQPPKV